MSEAGSRQPLAMECIAASSNVLPSIDRRSLPLSESSARTAEICCKPRCLQLVQFSGCLLESPPRMKDALTSPGTPVRLQRTTSFYDPEGSSDEDWADASEQLGQYLTFLCLFDRQGRS